MVQRGLTVSGRWISCGAAIGVGLIVYLGASTGEARPEYTRRTKKECLYCHPADSFKLTEAGEYYRDHRTLDGYKPKEKPKASAEPGAARRVTSGWES
jgi:hypothetical protein